MNARTRFPEPSEVGKLDLVGRRITLDHTLAAAMREHAFTEAHIALQDQGVSASRGYEGHRTASLVARDPEQRALADLAPVVDAVLAVAIDTVIDLIARTRPAA